MSSLTDIPGIGESTAAAMVKHGIGSVEALRAGGVEGLCEVPGFGALRASRVLAATEALRDDAVVEKVAAPAKPAAAPIKPAVKKPSKADAKAAKKAKKVAKSVAKKAAVAAKKTAKVEAKAAKKAATAAKKAEKKAKKKKK